MKIIRKLSDHIDEELNDARCYAKWAIEVKDERRGLADVLYSLSLDEMKHMNALHDEVVKIIEEYHKEHGDPPVSMQAVYDYLHEKQIEKAQEVRNYQALYREM